MGGPYAKVAPVFTALGQLAPAGEAGPDPRLYIRQAQERHGPGPLLHLRPEHLNPPQNFGVAHATGPERGHHFRLMRPQGGPEVIREGDRGFKTDHLPVQPGAAPLRLDAS